MPIEEEDGKKKTVFGGGAFATNVRAAVAYNIGPYNIAICCRNREEGQT
jgi:hypothetical protein